MSASERLHALDSLRAVAMFLGIVLHALVPFMDAQVLWPVRDVSRSPAFDVLLLSIHGFRMQLFFFIAGFFAHLLWQRLGTRQFLAQRARRILVPFLLGMGVIIPVTIAVIIWAERFMGVNLPQPEPPASGIPTMHLWFLEMLLVFYAAAMLIVAVWQRWGSPNITSRIDALFVGLMRTRWKPLLFVPATVVWLWNGPMLGEADKVGEQLLFAPRAIAYFGLFFAVGWLLHRQRHLLDVLQRSLATYLFVAGIAFVTFVACLTTTINAGTVSPILKMVALVSHELYAWTMTFALTGLFLRAVSRYRPWARYLADASYWCYLWHIPIVMALQAMIWKVPINAWIKLTFIVTVTMAILLATYHAFVRYTRIGELLNGPRARAPQAAYNGASPMQAPLS